MLLFYVKNPTNEPKLAATFFTQLCTTEELKKVL